MDLAKLMDCATVLSNANACFEFLNWAIWGSNEAKRFLKRGTEPQPPDRAMHTDDKDLVENLDSNMCLLKEELWKLKATMPNMTDLIDRAEWQCHKKQVADLLPHIKDAVYDAEDLLDEFDYYALKLKVESVKSSSEDNFYHAFLKFFDSVGSNDYIRKVKEIQEKLDHVQLQSKNMVLHEALQKFDKSVRPETDSFCYEKIFGREKELKQLVEKLGVRSAPKRGRMTELNVLPIVGMGGVGKTTMAKQICNNAKVREHFKYTIWICVSDNFDIKRLTKEILEILGENTASSNNLDGLIRRLKNCIVSKKILLVLDDMWDDVLRDDGAGWTKLFETLKGCAEGSMILVTTRFLEVANLVGPMNHYELKGLQDAIFWDFFKLCAFGSHPCNSQESLECIGKNILTKLKGSPLAAKTIGRLLRMDINISHWEKVMQSELWELEQTETDILPALRLSYMYLTNQLKRCFSICAIYPKDHIFEKEFLADIWVAQGYVVDAEEALRCFDDLANRSFFQKASPRSGKYVIHDLMHDTAQLISKDECFIIKHVSDIEKVPSNVRHLSIFSNGNVGCSELKKLQHKKKLRSLICDESYRSASNFTAVIDCWFKELLKIRVLKFNARNIKQLPESMGNSKHLRYLGFLGGSGILDSSVCHLHHLKIIDRASSEFNNIPPGLSHAISLQKIKSKSFTYNKNPNDNLCLKWSFNEPGQEMIMDNQMEVIPYRNIQRLKLERYGGESCPSWFRANLLPRLCSLGFYSCLTFKSVPFFRPPAEGSCDNAAQGFSSLTKIEIIKCFKLETIPVQVWSSNVPFLKELYIDSCFALKSIDVSGAASSSVGRSAAKGFSYLATISIKGYNDLVSLDEFLTPDILPVVETISLDTCTKLVSLSVDRLEGLQRLEIKHCTSLNSPRIMTFPPSLTNLHIHNCISIASININNSQSKNSSELQYLQISNCGSLKSIGGATAVDKVTNVAISGCRELNEIQQSLIRGHFNFVGR